MHFEILVEDLSGKKLLEAVVPRILGPTHTCRVISYKGLGRIPPDMGREADPCRRILLARLPQLLAGYGRAFASYHRNSPAAVIVVCDLDDKCLKAFRQELLRIRSTCYPQPTTRFCVAIEEGEAWLLGDLPAVKAAYPRAKDAVLNTYQPDSICGTWEKLADAVFPGGARQLAAQGWQTVGAEKSRWAEAIAPRMDVESNASPSFRYFRAKLRELAGMPGPPAGGPDAGTG
ncbi:MAG: DUF4276 family protein [Thermodesulfobacteriota bacterium]